MDTVRLQVLHKLKVQWSRGISRGCQRHGFRVHALAEVVKWDIKRIQESNFRCVRSHAGASISCEIWLGLLLRVTPKDASMLYNLALKPFELFGLTAGLCLTVSGVCSATKQTLQCQSGELPPRTDPLKPAAASTGPRANGARLPGLASHGPDIAPSHSALSDVHTKINWSQPPHKRVANSLDEVGCYLVKHCSQYAPLSFTVNT